MSVNTHGGKRVGSGRKPVSLKKQSTVVRVSDDRLETVRKLLKCDDEVFDAVVRTLGRNDGVSISLEKILQERLYFLEQDAKDRIQYLEDQLEEATKVRSDDYQSKYYQLTKELYPALERLRQLVPDERW